MDFCQEKSLKEQSDDIITKILETHTAGAEKDRWGATKTVHEIPCYVPS